MSALKYHFLSGQTWIKNTEKKTFFILGFICSLSKNVIDVTKIVVSVFRVFS